MKVKAVKLGYYGKKRRRPGEVFDLTDPAHFSDASKHRGVRNISGWMEVEEEAPPVPKKTAR